MARWSVTLLSVMIAAVFVKAAEPPVAQLEIWTEDDVAIATVLPDRTALRDVLAAMPEFVPRARPGSAYAAIDRTEQVLTSVSVTQVAPNRIRIRLASDQSGKGHRVIDAVAKGYEANGVKPRLTLASTRDRAIFAVAAKIVGAVALVALISEGFAAMRRRRRRRRLAI